MNSASSCSIRQKEFSSPRTVRTALARSKGMHFPRRGPLLEAFGDVDDADAKGDAEAVAAGGAWACIDANRPGDSDRESERKEAVGGGGVACGPTLRELPSEDERSSPPRAGAGSSFEASASSSLR